MPIWEELYEQNVEYVYKFLLGLLGRREDAQDLTQETFIKANQRWSQFDQRASVRTWLVSIARNLAIDRLRRNRRGERIRQLFGGRREETPPVPPEILLQSESRQELFQAIQTLKPDYRVVVVLKGLQEYSNGEIALILGWSESKVKVTYHRAIKMLRRNMQEQGGVSYDFSS
jgi:RNA polymerase sigma-70 factor, ECF subfamily